MSKKFNHLNVPDQWNHYWSRYPQGYTILEALISWVSQVDDMVDSHNLTQEQVASHYTNTTNLINTFQRETRGDLGAFGKRLDAFILQFDGSLQKTVVDTLTAWQASGFLDVVIDAALQTEMDNLVTATEQALDSFSEQLADINANVKKFGAVGDGVTDDTLAIQAAIDFVYNRMVQFNLTGGWNAGGGVVYFPKGQYKITATLILKENVSLKGESRFGVLIYAHTISDYALRNSESNLSKYYRTGEITDMCFVGAGAYFCITSLLTMRRVSFFNIGNDANNKNSLLIQLAVSVKFDDIQIYNCNVGPVVNGNAGVGPNTTIYFSKLWVSHCLTGLSLSGTGLNGIVTSSVKDTIIEYCKTGIIIVDNVSVDFEKLHLEQNTKDIDAHLVEGIISFDGLTSDFGTSIFYSTQQPFDKRHIVKLKNITTTNDIIVQNGAQMDIIKETGSVRLGGMPPSARLFDAINTLKSNAVSGLYHEVGQIFNADAFGEKICTSSGYWATDVWKISASHVLNDIVYSGSNVYKCTGAGTSGTVAPSHTSGSAIDGTVTWEYMGGKCVFTSKNLQASVYTSDSGPALLARAYSAICGYDLPTTKKVLFNLVITNDEGYWIGKALIKKDASLTLLPDSSSNLTIDSNSQGTIAITSSSTNPVFDVSLLTK